MVKTGERILGIETRLGCGILGKPNSSVSPRRFFRELVLGKVAGD
jgi:hypothetical protein